MPLIEFGPWACDDLDITSGSPTYRDLNHAITQISGAAKTLVIHQNMTMGAQTVTVPNTITLRFVRGGKLTVSSGQTLTIRGPIEAPPHQIFDQAIEGTIEIEPADGTAPLEVYPQWWGAQGDGTTDDRLSFQQAIDALVRGGTVFVPNTGSAYLIKSIAQISGQTDHNVGILLNRDNVHVRSNGALLRGGGNLTRILSVCRRYSNKTVMKIDKNPKVWDYLIGYELQTAQATDPQFAQGDRSIILNQAEAVLFSKGDIAILATLDGTNDTPFLFEFKRIAHVSAGTVTFETPIKIPYESSQSYFLVNVTNGNRVATTVKAGAKNNKATLTGLSPSNTTTKVDYFVGSTLIVTGHGAHTITASSEISGTGDLELIIEGKFSNGIPSEGDTAVIRNNLLVENTSVSGLVFDGNNGSTYDMFAVWANSFHATDLRFISTVETPPTGALLSFSWNTELSHSTFWGKDHGMQLAGLDNSRLHHNSVREGTRFGIYIDEPCGWMDISHNSFQDNRWGGAQLNRMFYGLFSHNLLCGNGYTCSQVGERKNLQVNSCIRSEISSNTLIGLDIPGYRNMLIFYKDSPGRPTFLRNSLLRITNNYTENAPKGKGALFNFADEESETSVHNIIVANNYFTEGFNAEYVENASFLGNRGTPTLGNNVGLNMDQRLSASKVWNAGSDALPAHSKVSITVTVPGATLGDMVDVSTNSTDRSADAILVAYVSAADTVTIAWWNPTSSSISIVSSNATYYVRVWTDVAAKWAT